MAVALAMAVGAIGFAEPAAASQDRDEWDYVCLVNAERRKHGRAPLQVTPGLRSVARSWSSFMKAVGSLGHRPDLGAQVNAQVTSSWQLAGENVGNGFNVPQVHGAFMASTSHRNNILDNRWEYIGVGVATGSPHYVTQNFLSSNANLTTLTDPYHSFVDVCSNHPFFDEVEWMADQGISTGYADGSYRPSAVVTRQSMSAFMHRLAGSPAGPHPDPGFPDVATHSPFHHEISWMATTGITTGYPDGTFRPGGRVSREAMSAFMFRFAAPSTTAPFPDPGFSDVPADHAFQQEIAWMAQAGVTTGYADGTFRPGAAVSRQAMSAFMQRLAED